MYHVLVVDDELPAVRFVCSIIERFSTDFHVAGTASSGKTALDFLRAHTVDLLITDISMRGIDGIELAKQARLIRPKIHIVIISGYGEFEYAQGAIQAGVDDYLLKPVSITKMNALLDSLLQKMRSENEVAAASLLPAIACARPYDKAQAQTLFGGTSYRFALVRWGNLDMTLPKELRATASVQPVDEHFQILQGRDDNEQILISEEPEKEDFLAQISVYMAGRGSLPTWTAVYTPSQSVIEELPVFIRRALNRLYQSAVIGRHQILSLGGTTSVFETPRLPSGEIRQFSYFLSSGKPRMVQDYFHSLAHQWDREKAPQRQVWHMGRQLIHESAAVDPSVNFALEDLLQTFNEQIRQAQSYDQLMDQLYGILVHEKEGMDRKMSPKELYDYTVAFIDQNYARPLSMQSVCDEVGISQTYLSRLFRKYSDTTFNTYLTTCRMEKAKQLLQEKPDFLLRDVAACVGYEDSSYFSRVFRQYTGRTPSQWAEEQNYRTRG